jgi:hypothetical protein
MNDIDKLFKFYTADGTCTLVTPRELMSRGMIVEAEEYASTHFKPVHDARRYSQRYKLRFAMVRDAAIRIADRVEPRFDPKLGYDFSTFLGKHLLGLNRICQSHHTALHGQPQFLKERERRRGYRFRALAAFGLIRWDDHRAALVELDQHQKNSLKLSEKAVLDWMIDPDGRTLTQVAEKNEIPKATASKTRWRLLLKANNCTGQ